ncbi:Por secretion system C-terminal sorting domain-containing protein [Flexibacter flexilis DSM 6793]|uniref:Por secretion system C-terminal sorting domain-containing protein n=1 Tax=Flexibacter flexilis DSM 6793 TaxID=927664 RepID=A0A1I1IVJ2_9BACT|nr:T9SS type A sorting domain-containing protein [Flexibacter flexilis]SFC40266.1 Por secretion system C-terminal sorting domain-containing protein [Flexibacter flexilis DSM 6793]
MKRKLLSLAALTLAFGAQAQIAGITVTPVGATAGDAVTITVNTTQTCPLGAGNSLSGGGTVRMHGGITLNGAAWSNLISGDLGTEATTGFTLVSGTTNVWQKTFVPSTHFNADPFAITALDFVLNSGVNGQWDNEGKDANADGGCKDFKVEFPITAAVAGTKGNLTKATLLSRVTNPVQKGTSTEILYSLPKADQVTVKVTNMLGQEVATLVNEFQSAGEQSVRFNAAGLQSGMYFYTVQAGKLVDTKKVVIAE